MNKQIIITTRTKLCDLRENLAVIQIIAGNLLDIKSLTEQQKEKSLRDILKQADGLGQKIGLIIDDNVRVDKDIINTLLGDTIKG